MLGLKVLLERMALPFVINLTTSMPAGIYRIRPVRVLERGMLVLFSLPGEIEAALNEREWFKKNLPLIKPVGALPGDEVCVSRQLRVNGQGSGAVSTTDFQGKPLGSKKGCYLVSSRAFLPISRHSEHSFDGRYFGEIHQDAILGEAIPVVTW